MATEEISGKIASIQANTAGAVNAIGEISAIIGEISDIQHTIASAVEEQTATTNEISRNISEAARGSTEIAENIAEKSPTVMRAAKESLNGIDLWDVKRSYRFEQGFTFELNLSGVADEHRDAFVEKRDTDVSK